MVIDAHQHLWQLSQPFDYRWLRAADKQPICRDFMPDDLAPLLRAADVDRSIVVQTQHNLAENRWALRLAAKHDFIAGVVGWIDLTSADCERQLLEFKDSPKFVGVRHVTQDEPDDRFIVRPDVLAGLRVLEKHAVPFDLLFYVKHLPHVAAVARAVPHLPLVLDHLAKPEIRLQRLDNWLPSLRAAAAFPNVHCKLSGLITEAHWKTWQVADLRPYVEAAIEHFGPHRCMFGSDWPVCNLAGDYAKVVGALRELISKLSAAEQSLIMGDVATRFYGLAAQEA
ncbi:MAG TPA: amidohydrolase family protein [Pirellulales bacterium]|jgi:L-fuconolactonase|nr:amidohydrolase family protein [Pirellulales bacterium]